MSKIEWYNDISGVFSLKLSLKNGKVSPILKLRNNDRRTQSESFLLPKKTKINKIVFKEIYIGVISIELFDSNNKLIK